MADTFYPLPGLSGATQFLDMQENGTAPGAAVFSPETKWRPATTAAAATANERAEMNSQATQAVADFDTTTKPLAPDNTFGNAFRTPTVKTGTYASGNWTIQLTTRAITTGYNGRMRYRIRVYRSTSTTGASPTEIEASYTYTPGGGSQTTATPMLTDVTAANILVNNNATLSVTWAAPSITLSSEYLFFCIALEVTSAPTVTTTNRELVPYRGTDTSIVTTDFSVPGALVQSVGLIPIG